jgi:hypothetical protein
MYSEPINWSGPSEAVDPRAARGSVADGHGAETPFELLLEAALGLADSQCSAATTSNNLFDMDADAAGLLTNDHFSTMSQLLSETRSSLPLGATNSPIHDPLSGTADQRSTTGTPVQQIDSAIPGATPSTSPTSGVGALNKNDLSDWMDAHALTRSSHHCAMYCRMGMEAAGLDTTDRPRSGDAGDYGPFLLRHGAKTISKDSYDPQVGDVVVFDKTSQHPFGHIEMYDGHRWVSDFLQHSLSPYRDPSSAPPFTIYRLA